MILAISLQFFSDWLFFCNINIPFEIYFFLFNIYKDITMKNFHEGAISHSNSFVAICSSMEAPPGDKRSKDSVGWERSWDPKKASTYHQITPPPLWNTSGLEKSE